MFAALVTLHRSVLSELKGLVGSVTSTFYVTIRRDYQQSEG
jgi:chromosome condensin MukBEF MukE localization factor